ncbi:MAG: PEP-CTERM-box response regulator transcription factor [Nitrospiria bacterium]
MTKPRLLIVEDDESICKQMKWALKADYDISLAHDRLSALEIVRQERPPLVTLDLGLPPAPWDSTEGLKALEEILAGEGTTKVIVITGNTDQTNAIRAISMGAYDFYCKPVDIAELQVILKRALYLTGIVREQKNLDAKDHKGIEGMLGSSPVMERIFTKILKVAASDFPVLILGESGTGKELAARSIHAKSNRASGPFIPINCGAIPSHLMEAELFGHEKGSFTGANAQIKGKFEYAHGGTLFLDEIGELDLSSQVKLLRFLQEHTIERVGGREEIRIDARIIAATNRGLKDEVEAKRFREDLYYRINVVPIMMPPLRERGTDIILLANRFLERFSAQAKKKIKSYTPSAHEAVRNYSWPGNVRELENRVRRGVIMAEGEKITAIDLDLAEGVEISGKKEQIVTLREARDRIDKELVIQALAKNHGNIKEAAAELGVTRQTLYDLIAKHSIQF